ncbi:MAG: EAL domain-containing protein, partial [Oscillatoria sp. SIO1A7]|nr:EAL domain-containing protein [Oscillatoria sp. SIO1A7]
SMGTAESPNANLNKSLDLAAVIKAYQVIASTIHIEDLIHQITKVILQHSGGDRCALILPNSDGVWQVKAIADPENIEIYSDPIEGNNNLPVKLIQYVKNTQKVVAVDDLDTDLPILDEFLSQQQPKSFLCLPILNQGRSIGILYLSNQSTRGVFTYDRIIVLNFICTQAAISLENARLYQTLEDYSQTLEVKVEERTKALQENEEQLRLAMSSSKQGFFDVNLQTDEAVVSPEYALMLGYDPANFHETVASWRARLHPEDWEGTSRAFRAYAAGQTPNYKAEFRQRTKQGDWKWIMAMGQFIEWDADGQPTRLLGTHTDISDRKFAEIQLQAQNELLAKIARGEPLSDIFNTLISIVEHNLDGVLCSILLIDKDNRLRHGAAPSLPSDYNQAVNGILIGEGVGSCGTAAFRNEIVIVSDIATDSLWCPYKDLALTYGLRACWSSPIAASDGRVLGTFAMYYPEVRSPQETELTVIVQMAHIAGIAIERQQAEERLRRSEATLLEAQRVARIGNWEFDIPSQTIAWSPEMFRIYGLNPSKSAPSYPEYLQMLPAEDSLRLQKYVERAIAEGTPYTIEYSFRSDGSLSHHESRAEVERDDRGQVIRLFGTTLDITERKQAEIALQNLITGTAAITGQDFFPALASHIAKALNVSYAIVSERAEERLRTLGFWANGALQDNFAYDIAKTPCELTLQLGKFYCEHSIQQRFPYDLDLVDMGAESYLAIALRNTQGQAIGNLCILNQQGIPDPYQAEQILQVFAARAAAELERQRAEVAIKRQLAAIEATIDGIGILKDDTYLYVNQAHLDLFGYEHPDDLVGKNWRLLYPPEELSRFEREILPILKRDRSWQGEAIAIRKDGSTFVEGVSLTLVEDGLLICICRDISDLKKARELIVHNALHDPLTDLPNRTLLLERLELAIERSLQIESYRYAVLFMDLDRFKVINDSLGHVVGDQLLIAIAGRLKKYLRKMDLVARLGGDEFVILLEDIDSTEDVLQIAKQILTGCQAPIDIKGHQIFTSISIGIVLGTKDYHQATDLIRDADIAMYRAKTQERNSYKFFDAGMHVEALKRLTLETDLRKAIDREEFTIHYQPIVDLLDCRLVGFEALVRWQHPTRGLISPGEFVPVAEETGLIALLDSWVFHKACEQIVTWNFSNSYPLKISINLSVPDLCKPTLIRDIDDVLANTGLEGNLINLEITESMLIEDVDKTIDLLAQLASRQIQIGIDDFGTGYSSLNYLHRLPVHNLKIDRSFVSQMQAGKRNYRVVSTIIALSKQLGLTVVAEGIETKEQMEQLQQLGCQFGQGYLFSKPLAPSDIESRFLGTNAMLCDRK